MRQSPRRVVDGFTLIELLVVVSIIVALLAMLMPAMDRAIRQAEMAVCSAKLDGLATATTTYAAQFKRMYPRINVNGRLTASLLRQGDDYRALIKEYVDINGAFNDPLVEEVNYETLRDDVWLWTSYDWFSAYGINGHRKMFKMGDRMTWVEPSTGRGYSFDLLAGDKNMHWGSQRVWSSSHPDADGVLQSVKVDESRPRGTPQDDAAATVSGTPVMAPVTTSYWSGPELRGALDLNWAYQDGSVRRFNRVLRDMDAATEDPRVVPMPQEAGAARYASEVLRIFVPNE